MRNTYYHEYLETGENDLRLALSEGITTLYNQSDTPLRPQYTPFFKIPLNKLLESGIVDQKNWLITTAHENRGSASSTIFSENGTPRLCKGSPPIRPLCPHLLTFADDQLWITMQESILQLILTYYQSTGK